MSTYAVWSMDWRRARLLGLAAVLIALTLALTSYSRVAPAGLATLLESYGRLPLSFEANQGQTAAEVQFLARGSGYSLFLTSTEAVLALAQSGQAAAVPGDRAAVPFTINQSAVLRLQLVGADPLAQVRGDEPLPGVVHYLLGDGPAAWPGSAATYGRVTYRAIYPGIDLVYYGRQGQLEYDFVVAPGASAEPITLAFAGADRVTLDTRGDLLLDIAGEQVRLSRPVMYQVVNGRQRPVSGGYARRGEAAVGFQVESYDTGLPLVIDPVLTYATYLGGSGDDGAANVAVAADGSAFVVGYTFSADFPTTSGPAAGSGGYDAFVAKLNPAGDALVYTTFVGGSADDGALDVALDATGNAYVAGITRSSDFPTVNPVQASFADGYYDAFLAKLNTDGSALVYSTYLGGTGYEGCLAVAVDAAGAAYVAGCTHSADFPIANALQAAHAGVNSDAFVAKVSADGSALAYATYLGGTDEDFINGLAVDSLGRAVVVGETYSTDFPLANAVQAGHRGGLTEGFVARLDAAGSSLDFATYLGGADDDSANGVAVDTAGRVYVAGQTRSVDFPTVNAIQTTRQGTDADAFAAKFTASGTGLLYATYLGGSGRDGATSVAVNANGSAVVVGATASADFPVANPSQAAFAGGETDAFVAKLSPNGAMLQYATYLGGSQFDWATSVALDGGGQAYAAGFADSADLPTANGLQTVIGGQHDAFLVKLSHDDDGNGTADLPTLDTVTVTEQTESPLSMAGGGGDPTGLALAPQAPVAMSLYTVTDTAINQAICNDGTPAVFYYRRGDGSGTNKWQIYLEGGGFCNDVASCNARYITNRQLMTSNGAAPTRMGGGILNPDPVLNPDFHNVNTVFIHYCSSDSWGGDREASADTGNWHFRGKRIIEAVVATLQDPAKIPSPNLADATHVFFSGTSSGGVGAMSFVDWLTAELPWATVKGMNDAGWAIQVAPYNPTFRTWYETFEMGHSFWNGTVDASCAAAYPATPYYCYLGMLAVPHVSTPFFVHAAQLDQELLNTFLGLTPPYDLNEEAYALTYAGLVRDSLAPFPAVFSPRGRFHGILNTVRFFNLSAGGLTLRPMLGTWYNNTAGPIKIVEINRPPTATFANTSGVINEGQSATLTFSGVTDPDPGDTALGFRYGFDCTNDGTFELQHVPTASFACAYADSGTYTAHGRVKDDLGAARDYTIQVTVLNVAPIVAAGADRIVYRNDVVNLSGSWTDAAGALDGPFAWSWDLTGDGLADTSGTAAYGVSVPATTSFATEGFYTLEFIVTDKDGGQGKDSLVVEVLNRPPDCSAAAPSTATLWSPNHEFVPITILGVTDPEGDSITITVDSIWQDEITDGNGDGNTEVDGQGVGTSVAQVRAERAGGGDGRVYHISFTAADGHGGLCSGTVLVSVPHDQNSPGGEAVDGGALYDSTIGTP